MKIYYGITNDKIDVTNICLEKLLTNNIITIPLGDRIRSIYFTDPLINVHKSVFIENNGNESEYNEFVEIIIDLSTDIISISENIDNKLAKLHSKLKINYGSFYEEFPEQKMAAIFLTGAEKVLEIGGNIGRNSLIIASILENSNNLVTLECDENIAKQLTENRDLNDLQFHIECSALSNRKLIQKGWDTKPTESEILEEGYNWVKTITLDNLKSKYSLVFDTLVLDCEGAFYYILMDMPEILNNIKLIIMENDYHNITHKNYVDETLRRHNFNVAYVEAGGWGPCYNNFFEVWKRVAV